MSTTSTYVFTALAGTTVAGRKRGSATTIDLTDEEAEYELRAGTIVLATTLVPPSTPVPVILATDTVEVTRNGAKRTVSVGDLAGVQPTSPALSPIVAAIIFG